MKELSVFTTKIVQSMWFKDDVFAFEFLIRIFPPTVNIGGKWRGGSVLLWYIIGI